MESSSVLSSSSPQGSHGAEEEDTHEFQEMATDLEVWDRDMQSRLRLIPDPSETLKYKPTCTTIQQLQEAMQEVVERHSSMQSSLTPDQPSSVDLQALLDSMAEKQERLFESVVHFLQLEVVRLADVLEESERLLGEGPLTTEGYVDQQTQLHRLKGTREELSSCEAELLSLNDTPHPLKVSPLSLEQQQQGLSPLPSPAATPGVYTQFTDLHSRLVVLLLKCQELAEKFEEKIDHLEKELHSHRERFVADLSEVEAWLAQVYSLLCQEPARETTEGYGDQKLESEAFVVMGGEVDTRDTFVAGGGRERVKYPSEPCSFDSVDGNLMMMMEGEDGSPFDKQVLNSSVDIALEDEEYEQEVLKRVLSPVEGEGEGEGETAEQEMEGGEGHVDPLLFEMEEEGGREKEEEGEREEREEIGSVSSESTLHSEPQRRSGVSKDAGERVQSLAEEFSEGGVEVPEEWVTGEECVTGEGVEVGESGEEEPEEVEEVDLPEEKEEEEESSQEEASLQWVKELHVLPMEHEIMGTEPTSDQPEYNPASHDIDYILGNLESVLGQLTIQSQKVKRSIANINFVMNTVSVEMATELKERLTWINQHWEPLAGRVRHRIAQMKFEKAQKETVENIQEVVTELENQPETNLLPEEVEEKFSQLMDFIIDLETFESQKAELIGQLESTLHPLTQFPQENPTQLRRTTEKLKQGYETVTEKVKQQKVLLERWRDQWNKFSRQLSHFEDWVGRAEELVTMETYGHSLTEMEAHVTAVKHLKQQVSVEETKVQYLIDLGNTILACVQRGGEAERHIDSKLSEAEERWFNLVTQGDGVLDQRESAANKVLINWRAYTDMYRGTQSFVTQMVKMVGTEPLEASGGNTTLLPTYRTYADQLRAMEVQYKRLQSLAEGLSSNPRVGGGAAILEEMENLNLQWGPLKDNIVDSLDMLRREHEGWVLGKLQQMSSLVEKVEEVVKREVAFVEEFPLETLMEEDASVYLREVDELVASQDKLGQLETDCTHIEEELLGRQIQLETAGHPASELDTEATLSEHQRLQQARDDLQTKSDALLSVLNVFFLQLQLLQKVQEAEGVISIAMDFVGDQNELEATLADIQLKLSEDHLERLCSDAYDLGSVSEEYEASLEMEHDFTIPSYNKVVQVNHTLTKKVEELSDSANSAKVRLQLFIEWWAEYCSNYGDISPWLEGVESRLGQLVARGESTQAPLVSPVELLQDAKELDGEMTEKAVVLSALASTGQNILDEMESKGAPPSEISDQLLDVKERWEALASRLKAQLVKLEGEVDRFNKFLTEFTGFVNWLAEFRDTLYDEVCVQIPQKAAEETILHHRAQLEDFRREVESRESQFHAMMSESEVWADHLVPDECQSDLPSPSEESGEEATDFPFDIQLPFIKNRMKMAEKKWSNVKQLLRERENQLELSLGTTVVFLQTVAELLAWLAEKLQLEAISATPPASVESLRGIVEIVESTRGELTNRQLPIRRGLERTADSLKAQLSGANAENVEQQLAEVNQQWQRLVETLDSRETALSALISDIEGYWSSVAELEAWLGAGEARMEECGPIGANLLRLVEQSPILETLDEDVLSHKKDPEELHSKAMNIIKACCEGSGEEILHCSQQLQSRFDALSQVTLESRELCEEATSAMQEFQGEFSSFSRLLEGMEEKLVKRKKKKYPVGTVEAELEEHYEFMRECEQQTDQYSDLYCHGNRLSAKYKPSDALDAMMSSLHNRWAGHVAQMIERSEELLGIKELWEKYEGEVKKLLNWIMAEADKFSSEVTTLGDKGIEDHIMSCKELSSTLGKKQPTIVEIQDLAEILRAEDGAKKNGTSDVESRWQDVSQHWNSLCKLLGETLLHLEATFAEVRHVLQITEEEFHWLERCEHAAAVRRTTHGNLQIVQEEIDTHYQLSQEIQEHQNDALYIHKSADFLVEHSQKTKREELAARANDYTQRYYALLTSVDTYVRNMQDSIPVWKEFNDQYQTMAEWLGHVDGELGSEHTQPGNAIATERSLEITEGLLRDIQAHQETFILLRTTAKTLSRLCIPEDQAIVQGRVEEVEGEVGRLSEQASCRIEELKQRLKSWQVFPVEEAKMVQEFLVQAEEEVEEEMAEDLSAGELQEKLKRLESLQELRLCNEDKVTTIERSAESEEVKKALEKNPDISKERSNLLQGWSHVTFSLKDRIGGMRRRAKMVQDLEEALHTSSEALRAYQGFLDRPLPPSILLAARQQELHDTGVTLHNTCQSGVTNLLDVLEQYTTATDIQVPTHLRERAAAIDEKFQVLVGKATEWTNQITETVNSWREFHSGLEEFSTWLRSASSELSSLKVIEMFLMEFSSLESRLELLCEEVEEKRGEFEALSSGSQRHLLGEEEEVLRTRQRFEKVERGWQSMQEDVRALPEAMKPWKDLTDQFDELSIWLDELEERVEEEEVEGGGDPSDSIVNIKDYLLKMSQQSPKLQDLKEQADALFTFDLCQQYDPAHNLREECREIEERWEKLRERLQLTLQEVKEKATRWKEEALSSVKEMRQMEHCMTAMTAQIKDQEALIDQLRAGLAAAPTVGSRPKTPLSLLTLLSLLCILAAIVVLYLFLAIEPPAVVPI